MYFESRHEAGRMLAAQLAPVYSHEKCAVVALSDGAVQVGEPIAAALSSILTMLLIEEIEIPGENATFGGVSEGGGFTFNASFSSGEIDEYVSEFHGYLDEQKRVAFQRINRLVGAGGTLEREMIRDRVVILVSDGLDAGVALDVAVDFLKPVRIKRLVIASPIASVGAVDKLHIMADELHILDVKENYMGTDHYYETNDVPSHAETVARINNALKNPD